MSIEYSTAIKERSIQSNNSILQSLKKMDLINKKLLLVFKEEVFIGVLSIGDIQKAIIANLPMNTSILEIMRKDFVYAKITDDKETIIDLMQEHRIECMPVLDEHNSLISVYLWSDILDVRKAKEYLQINLPVVIMAGGQGTRLKPLTNILPKSLIPIGEKTIIEQIMDKFCDAGCNTFYLSVNYKAEMIKYYFSTLPENPYHILYLHEEKPLGTAGSLHLLKGKINSTFFVTNCDILIDQNISDIYNYHITAKNEITIVAALLNYTIPYGILETSQNGLLQSLTEKPELTFKINTGFYILEPNLLSEIPDNVFFHITQLIEIVTTRGGKVGVFPVSNKSWRDIGEWSEYKKFLE